MSWPQCFNLSITKRPNTPGNDSYGAFWNAWQCLRRGMSANLRRKPCRKVLTYAEIQASDHWWEYDRNYITQMAEGGVLSYFFSDEQGNANVYCGVAPHWMEIVLGQRYDEIKRTLTRCGYVLESPRPDLAAIAAAVVDSPFVEVDKFVAQLMPNSAGEGWELDVDLSATPASQVGPKERARLDKIFAAKRCMCDFCQKLRKTS